MNTKNEVITAEVGEVAKTEVSPLAMLNAAIERGVDTDTLGKLMDLQARWEADEARKAYTRAMTAFKAEGLSVTKDKQVSFSGTSYTHASLANVVNVVAGALSRHGLSHQWQTSQADGMVVVRCTITHERGHSESVTLSAEPDDSGKKNRIQQIGSTVTYLQRYTLMAITGLAAKDMDDDGAAYGNDDPNREAWIDAIKACSDADELKARKREMVDAYSKRVPPALIDVYNARLRELKDAA